jgi:hypothetical protein
MTEPTHEQIAVEAYRLHLANPSTSSEANWTEAETNLKVALARQEPQHHYSFVAHKHTR